MSMSDPEISENSVDEEIPIPEHIRNNPEWQELQDPNLRFYIHLGAAFAVKTESGPPQMMHPDVTVSVSGDASNFPETPRVMMRVRINNKQSLKVRAMLSLLPEVLRPLADYKTVVNGAIIVVAVIFMPRGLLAWRMGRAGAAVRRPK